MAQLLNCPDCGHANLAGEEDCAHCHAPLASLATPQPKQGMQRRILEGTVADLGSHEAASVSDDAPLAEAIRVMRARRVGCVLAMRDGVLSGILTERDVLLSAGDPAKVKVAEVMRRDPDCLADDQPLAFAFHKMSLHGLRHLPVRRADGSLGVVSSRDLLRYLCE